MPFDADIVLTGLCAYVPDEEIGLKGTPILTPEPKQMWVFLPDARRREAKSKALDGRKLRMHLPLLNFSLKDLKDSGSADLPERVVVPIMHHAVTFDPTPAGEDLNGFKVIQEDRISDGKPVLEDFRWGAHVREIADENIVISPNCFKPEGADLGAKVFFDKGSMFTSGLLEGASTWDFSGSLGGAFKERYLSNEVTVRFRGLRELTIYLTPFGIGGMPRKVVFARDSGTVGVGIGNLCEACLFEDVKGVSIDPPQKADEDFRWLYEVCGSPEQIKDRLKILLYTRSLPIPRRVKMGKGKGGGSKTVECMRVTYPKYKIY